MAKRNYGRTNCSGCGATTLAKHNKKIQNKGVYAHIYDGPGGKHSL